MAVAAAAAAAVAGPSRRRARAVVMARQEEVAEAWVVAAAGWETEGFGVREGGWVARAARQGPSGPPRSIW